MKGEFGADSQLPLEGYRSSGELFTPLFLGKRSSLHLLFLL